jgi:CheY-like chemotaxis protein
MSNGGGLRVLVVRGDRASAGALADLLRSGGHEVAVAPEGRDAVEAARVTQPDVVFFDGVSPGAGDDVARAIHGQSAWRRPFLVALAGAEDEASARRSAAAGIDLHLVKPADPDRLLALLRRFRDIVGDARGFDPAI